MLDLSIAPRRAPIYVSILRPSPGERARVSKLITNAGEKVKTDLKVTRFDVELLTANTPADALTMIQRALDAPDSCVVFENPTDIALEALDGQGIARNFRRVVDSNHPDEPRPLIAHEQHTYVNRADLDGLDLDDFGLPPFDATNPDIDTLNTIADALGWTDASFVWEISASQDAGGTNLLRVHLFSINSRPLSNTVRRRIAESLPETLHVDAGAASSRGAVFYNAPEVIDHDAWKERGEYILAPDPIPQRTGTVWRGKHETDLTPPSAAEVAVQRSTGTRAGRTGLIHNTHAGEEADGITDRNIHDGLLSAVWGLCRRNRLWKERHVRDEILRQLDTPEARERLPTRHADAIARVKNGMDGAYKWSRQRLGPDLIPDIPPEFPAREVPVDTAQTQIAVAVKELLTAGLSSHHGKATLISGAAGVGKTRQVIDQLRKPVRVNATYAWYRAQQTVEGVVSKVWKTRRVETFLDWDATHEPGAERSLLWGLEKQSSHAQSITRLEQRPLRVHWYAPTLELCEETYTRLTADKDETGESIRPVTAAVLRGRGYVHAQDDDGNDIHLCKRHKLADKLRGHGFETEGTTLCVQRGEGDEGLVKCPHFEGCPYIDQFKEAEQDEVQVLIRATASLASPTSIAESYAASLGRRDPYRPPWTPDTVIIDESPLPYMLKSKRMPIDKFSNINPGLQAVVRHLQDGKDLHTLGEEVLEHLYQLHPDNIDPVRIASPDMSDEEIAQAIRMAPAPPSIDWDAVYPIVHAIENGLPCNSVWLERPRSDGSQYVRYSALKRPSYPAKTNYLLLDATLDAELLRPIWPTAKLVEVHPEQNIIVTQVATASFSHSSLLVDAEGEAAGNPHVVKELNDLVAVVRQQFSKPVGVICPKALEPAIEADLTAHFGALRGLDGFKHMGVLMVVGRTLPPALDVESTARALYPHVELDLPGAYKWGALGWRLRGGGAQFGVNDLVHPDPLVHRVLRSVREAEVVQAVGRIRGVHRRDPAHVFILGSLPVDVTVDYLVENPRELYADGILELVHKCGGTMPLSVADLRKRLGDEIGKEDAIEDRIRRQKDRGSVSEYLKFPALARVSRGATADSVERLVYISTKQSTESAVDAARQGVPGFLRVIRYQEKYTTVKGRKLHWRRQKTLRQLLTAEPWTTSVVFTEYRRNRELLVRLHPDDADCGAWHMGWPEPEQEAAKVAEDVTTGAGTS